MGESLKGNEISGALSVFALATMLPRPPRTLHCVSPTLSFRNVQHVLQNSRIWRLFTRMKKVDSQLALK